MFNGYFLACFLGAASCSASHNEAKMNGPGGYTSEAACQRGMLSLFAQTVLPAREANQEALSHSKTLYFKLICRNSQL